VAVLLTGMGSDGAVGMQAIRAAGGTTIAQDEATSVVYGMPRAAVELGVVDQVAALEAIPTAIVTALTPRAPRGRAGNTSP
jgi:two-component system chemotaxis response regulator CheB